MHPVAFIQRNFFKLLPVVFFILTGKLTYSQGDNCDNALQITNVVNYCSGEGQFTNLGSTDEGVQPSFCWTGTPNRDVWFRFTAIAPAVFITVTGSGSSQVIKRPRIALYDGCSGGFNQACADGTTGNNFTQLFNGVLTPGNEYYIRVSSTSTNTGRFKLCVNNYSPPVDPGSDCDGATFLCTKDPFSIATFFGPGADNDEAEPGTCMDIDNWPDEANSVWLYWTCATAGSFTFDLLPVDPTQDIDYILYRLSGTNLCSGRTWMRCNSSACVNSGFAGPGSTGINPNDPDISEDLGCESDENAYCNSVNLFAGVSYALLINNATAFDGFTIQFGGTAEFAGAKANIIASQDTICKGSSVSFDGSTSTDYKDLEWNFSSGGGTPSSANGAGPFNVTYNQVGVYSAILNATRANCPPVTAAQTVVVLNNPGTPTITGGNVCEHDSLVLIATGEDTLTWSGPGGYKFIGATLRIPNATQTESGTYSVYSANSICSGPAKTIQISILPKPQITSSVIQTSLCDGDSSLVNIVGADSYEWIPSASVSIPNPGTAYVHPSITTSYLIIGKNNNGCSDTITFQANILPGITADAGTDLTICEGDSVQLSAMGGSTFSWSPSNGLSGTNIPNPYAKPTQTTKYQLYSTSGSCTDIDSIEIVVVPIPQLSISGHDSICRGDSVRLTGSAQFPITWSTGVTANSIWVHPDSTTTFYAEVFAQNNCTRRVNKQILVKQGPQLTTASDSLTICESDSIIVHASGANTYYWEPTPLQLYANGDSILIAPTNNTEYLVYAYQEGCIDSLFLTVIVQPELVIDAGSDQKICFKDSVLLSVNGGSLFEWSVNGNPFSNTNSVWIKPQQSAQYFVNVRDGSCQASDSLFVNVLPLPDPTINGDNTICVGDTVSFSATRTQFYHWYPNHEITQQIIFYPSSSSVVALKVTDKNNCSDSSSVLVQVNPLPNVAIVGLDSVCETHPLFLTATGASQYIWQSGYATTLQLNVNATTDTLIRLRGIDANGCVNYDSIFIRILPNPSVSVAPQSIETCKYTVINFTASGTDSYIWPDGSTATAYQVQALSDQQLLLYGRAINGCTDTASFFIKLLPQPTVNITGPDSVCPGVPFNLVARGGVSYLWSTNDISSTVSSNGIPTTTNFIVIGTDTNSCADSAEFVVNVFPVKADFSYHTTYNTQPSTLHLQSESLNPSKFIWYLNGQAYGSLSHITYSYPDYADLTFMLFIENSIGCKDSIEKVVPYDPFADLYIPRAFSPDGDYINDLFFIKDDRLEKLEITVFNRWGEVVWKTNSLNAVWDGTYQGQPIPVGTYAFEVKYRFIGALDSKLKGSVFVVR